MNEVRLRDGRRLVYAELGSPHGTPIVHCHGAPSSRIEGEFLFDGKMLAELGVRLIVPDRPGTGARTLKPAAESSTGPTTSLISPMRRAFEHLRSLENPVDRRTPWSAQP